MGKIYSDGSSCAFGSAFCVMKEGEDLKHIHTFDRKMCVYDIEYLALIHAMQLAKQNDNVFCDNQQIVSELMGWKDPKNPELYKEALKLIDVKNLCIYKIPREENPAGFYLERRLGKLKKYARETIFPRLKKQKRWKK